MAGDLVHVLQPEVERLAWSDRPSPSALEDVPAREVRDSRLTPAHLTLYGPPVAGRRV